MTETRWPSATKNTPCVVCGHTRGCRNAPDGGAAVCWHDGNGGKVIQVGGGSGNGSHHRILNGTTGYVIAAHKKKSGTKGYLTAGAAITAAVWNVPEAKLSATWSYPGDQFKIARFDTPDGKKHIRPVHLANNEWRVGDPPEPLPLYRADEIPGDVEIIFVTEGEKCADLVRMLGLIAVTSSHGSNSAARSNWTIADQDAVIVFLPDNDPDGELYVADGCRVIFQRNQNARIKIVRLPDLPPAGDIEQYIEARDSMESEAIAAAILAMVKASPFIANPERGPMPLGELWQQFPELREPVVNGMLRRGQVGNIISTSKSYKTYLILGMAVSMTVGRLWLDRFEMLGSRVLIIDLELQPGDIVKRTRDIAAAMHAPLATVAANIDIQSFRGRAGTIDEIEKMLLRLAPRTYDLVIIDPLYKTYPADFDENSNAQMTALYRRWERLAEHLDAGIFIVHHGTKGSQSEKRVVDVGAGASAQSRSADAHIALREHEVENCVVFDSRMRSFPPVDSMVMRWDYPLWHRDTNLSPEDLKSGRKSRNADKAEPQPAEKPEPWTVARFTEQFVSDDPKEQRAVIDKAVTIGGLTERNAQRLCRLAISEKLVHRWTFATDRRATYLATIEQPVTAIGEAPK